MNGPGRPAAREVDRLTVSRLTGAAWRHAAGGQAAGAETAAAVRELREIAGGRGDLLAEVAGLLIGYYRRTAEELKARAAAYYCLAAAASLGLIPLWIEVGCSRAAATRLIPQPYRRQGRPMPPGAVWAMLPAGRCPVGDNPDVRQNRGRTRLNSLRVCSVSESADDVPIQMPGDRL